MILGSVTKQPAEVFPVTVDFAAELATGETVSSGTVTARNASTGVDTTSTVTTGSATASGTTLAKKITGGADGVDHILTFTATTSASNVYEAEVSLIVRAT